MQNNRIEQFKEALTLINDNSVRNFCETLLINADDYFFTEPASSTGKYHPQFALGEGGLARHSISVAKILAEILRTECYEFTPRQQDMLICAAIVHDIKKYGTGKRHTVKEHPELAAEYIMEQYTQVEGITEEDAKYIADAVKTHMGQWGAEKPSTDAQKVVHIADCLSSRKWLEVKFENNNSDESFMVTEVVTPKETQQDPGEYVLPFGKYNGQKLKDVDPDYIEFLANKFGGQNHPAAKNARLFLKLQTKS